MNEERTTPPMSIEDRVRETLRRQAEAVDLSPDAWDRIEERARPAGRPPWPVLALGAVAAVLVVVAVAVSLRSGDGDAHQVAADGSSTTVDDEPTTTTMAPTTTAPPATTATTTAPTVAPPPTSEPSTTTTSAAPTTTTTTAPPTTTTAPPSQPVVTPADRLALDSLGPIRVGMTVQELSAATGSEFTADYAFEDDSCGYAVSDDLPGGIWLMISEGTVTRIGIGDIDADGNPVDNGFTTVSGIGVGASEDEVQAAYPGRITVEPHPYTGPEGHYLVYTPQDDEYEDYLMIFETDGQQVTSFRSGLERWVRAIEGCA